MKLSTFRNHYLFRALGVYVALSFLVELAAPTVALALTSGPSQPEVQSFEPAGTTEMVDLFSGDFVYNIPLLELPGPNGGYPFNLSYHSGVGMDQEASWVGLGWNLNPGVINRNMRGLPDDFKGDPVRKTSYIKPNYTYGLSIGGSIEIFGGDANKGSGSLNLNLGMRIYYNNYKGVGYNLSPAFGYGFPNSGIGVGVGPTLDSQEGVGANASVSLSKKFELDDGDYSSSAKLGFGFNSKRGLSLSLSGSGSQIGLRNKKGDKVNGPSTGGSSTISFAQQAFTPSVSLPMKGSSTDLQMNTGLGLYGVYNDLTLGGFYSIHELPEEAQSVTYAAFGYNHLESAGSLDLMDFNRTKDGIVRKESPNLATTQLTYDFYNVMGQGIGGMYRPYRSEIGHVHDPTVVSSSSGNSFGTDIGPRDHYGLNATYTSALSTSGDWTDNHWSSDYTFRGNGAGAHQDYEAVYYKTHGEMTSFKTDEMNYIGGEAAVRASLNGGSRYKEPEDNKLVPHVGAVSYPTATKRENELNGSYRMPRNMSIQPVTHKDIGENTPVLNEYAVKILTPASPTTPQLLDRVYSPDRSHHIGGITSINSEGVRYVYGLPAYNTSHVEFLYAYNKTSGTACDQTVDIPSYFSSPANSTIEEIKNRHKADASIKDNTDQFFSATETPPYAYSYMLTSILGTDYVDVDGIPGPSDGDMGYWVKFTYKRAYENYVWKAPYWGANYIKGYESSGADDKATFTQGTKEVYYLSSAETKTHIVEFTTGTRDDGREAVKYGNTNQKGSSTFHKLTSMKLSVKGSSVPLQTIDFKYNTGSINPSLCKQVENGDGTNGKLTLTELQFNYQHNKRGSLSPYKFSYGGDNNSNPNYSPYNYDRWGNYKPDAGACERNEFPYVQQFDHSMSAEDFKEDVDFWATSWHLTKIELPTGGEIQVDYEADDYAYVQHKRPMQMFKIDHLETNNSADNNLESKTQPNWKVYFELEHPIPDTYSRAERAALIKKQYLDGLKVKNQYQLHYNVRVNLRQGRYEAIGGYANLDVSDDYKYGTDDLSNGFYHKGFITLDKMNINGDLNYHPFRVAAWQHMRTDQPDLLFAPGKLKGDVATDAADQALKAKSLVGIGTQIKAMFRGYRKYAESRKFASSIVNNRSYIRLTNPDGFKVGGGSRVKKIAISDNWNDDSGEAEASYGQVYDYTIEEGNELVSSGVAQYEPMIGGNETPFRIAKIYEDYNPVMTENSLFYEYPINESYFPAASVGYRKVTVRSLATDKVLNGTPGNSLPPTASTTGAVEHEFYTAKEYPVITAETNNQTRKNGGPSTIPIPLIGQIVTNTLAASQGYSITLNDMHGKQRSVTYYGMDKNGALIEEPVSSVRYSYKDKPKKMKDGTQVRQLDNRVKVLLSDYNSSTSTAEMEDRIMGVEYEFFTDMRKNRSTSTLGGLSMNTDLIIVPWLPPIVLPIPAPWPAISRTTTDLRTVTTNKIIHKAAILDSIVASDGKSTVHTANIMFDGLTGKPLLTTVQNNYDQPLYKMEYPAHWNYEGMNGAYKNFGVELTAQIATEVDDDLYGITDWVGVSGDEAHRILQEGDELLITHFWGIELQQYTKATLTKHLDLDYNPGGPLGQNLYYFEIHAENTDYLAFDQITFKVIRSGRRNQLNVMSGEILAKTDPTTSVQTENLNQVDLSNAPADFVDFMNNEVLDCNGNLKVNFLYDLDGYYLFDEEGNHKYPQTKKLLKKLEFGYCTSRLGGHLCEHCQELDMDNDPHNAPTSEGYHITNIDERTGTNNPGGCECVAYRRKLNSSVPTEILGFSSMASGTSNGKTVGKLQVTYNDRGPSEFCVFPEGSGYSGWGEDFMTCWDPVSYVPQVTYISDVLNASAVEFSDYWNYDGPIDKCNTTFDPNLYASGKKGIFRVSKNYYYQDIRKQSKDAVNPNLVDVDLSDDGIYTNDGNTSYPNRFYPFKWNATLDWPIHERWVPNQTITRYNKGGFEVENRDVLGNYSSAKYGYGKTLPTAVAANASYDQLYVETADDNTAAPVILTGTASVNAMESHTGQKSIEIAASSADVKIETGIKPSSGGSYYFSAWVKVDDPSVIEHTYDIGSVSVEVINAGGSPTLAAGAVGTVGGIVEGWQKLEGEIDLPSGEFTKLNLILEAAPNNKKMYYDDIRMISAKGNVKTYVYHSDTYRLNAVLDENNFASLYYYDEQGKLYLVKKETEQGIFSIQESRNHVGE